MGSVLLVVVSACIVVAIAVDPGPTKDSDDVYLQLLRRVENLEKRDQQQQSEIDTLRGELNTEKQRTAVLEGRLARLYMRIAEQRGKDEATTRPADAKTAADDIDVGATQKTSDQAGQRLAARKASPEIKTGEQPARARRQVGVPVVAFHATLSTNALHSGLHQGIAFDNVITNIGTAYNPHVGLFVAPVTGVYVFHTTIMTLDRDTIDATIAKNGFSTANLYVQGVELVDGTVSAVAVLHLTKGDDVMVENLNPDKAIHGGGYSMFSGFLLHEDDGVESIVG